MRSFNRTVLSRKEIYALAADKINECVTMREVMDFYSIDMHRGGFVCCPFHVGDRTASLKVYENSWYCFGCKRGSTVVDFVKEYDRVGYHKAIENCNRYFSLNIPLGEKHTILQEIRAKEEIRRRRKERDEKEAEHNRLIDNYNKAFDGFAVVDCAIISDLPSRKGEMTDRFANAIREYATAKYEYQEAEAALSAFENGGGR